jgi:hypothetical protein
MSFSIIAAVAPIAISGAGLGLSLSGAQQPAQPNLSTAAGQLANVEAQLLPEQLQTQAAAELGQSTLTPGFTKSTDANGNPVYYQLRQGFTQGTDASGNTVYYNRNGNVVSLRAASNMRPVDSSRAISNFSGKSTADIQGQLETQLAQGQLATQAQYDPQFIAQALAEEQQANPEGFAARAEMYKDIQNQINNPLTSPVSNEMQRQVSEKVAAGSNLTPEEQAMLNTAVNQGTAARGDAGGQPDFSTALTTGQAGTAREMANAGEGINWLESGQTPEDIQYRQEQQNLSNLSNYVSGATPESQFRELTGAQSGATPIAQGAQLPSMPTNAAGQGAQGAIATYGAGVNNALNSVNPWLSGLSGVLGASNVAASAGWKPLSTNP